MDDQLSTMMSGLTIENNKYLYQFIAHDIDILLNNNSKQAPKLFVYEIFEDVKLQESFYRLFDDKIGVSVKLYEILNAKRHKNNVIPIESIYSCLGKYVKFIDEFGGLREI